MTKGYSQHDEIVQVLAASGGWMGTHALLQRCDLIATGDQLGDALAKLYKAGTVQRRSGALGLEYAVAGTTVPTPEAPREARGPAPVAERVQTDAAPRPRIAVLRSQHVAERQAVVRNDLISLFRARPVRTCRELQQALGRSQPIVSGYLRAMREQGLVEQRGAGSRVLFVWRGTDVVEPAQDAGPQVAPAEVEQPAVAPGPEPAPARAHDGAADGVSVHPSPIEPPAVPVRTLGDADAMFRLFTGGELAIAAQGLVCRVDGPSTKALFRFLLQAHFSGELT